MAQTEAVRTSGFDRVHLSQSAKLEPKLSLYKEICTKLSLALCNFLVQQKEFQSDSFAILDSCGRRVLRFKDRGRAMAPLGAGLFCSRLLGRPNRKTSSSA